jgi:hypothetical protein
LKNLKNEERLGLLDDFRNFSGHKPGLKILELGMVYGGLEFFDHTILAILE